MLALAFATARECAAALPETPAPRPGTWKRVRLSGREAAVLVTGVGPLNAALGLGRLLGEAAVDGVLNLGVAGSFDSRALPPGTITVAVREIWPEYGLRTQAGVDAAGLGFPLAHTSGAPVHDRISLDPAQIAEGMELSLPPDWARVASLTVSAVSADMETAAHMTRTHAPDTENMEGFALALGCLHAGLPFLEIRAVSNAVGSRAPEDWNLKAALDALGAAVRTLFEKENSCPGP